MDGTMFCVTCGSQQQAEYDHRTRVTACGTCGSILDSTAQVVTGAEETGEFTGRSFVYHGEERLFTAYSADAHRLVRGSRESGETYQAARMGEIHSFMKRLMVRFSLDNFQRIDWMWKQAKDKTGFSTGSRASKVFAAAAVYVCTLESKRRVAMSEVAFASEIEYPLIDAAQRRICVWCDLSAVRGADPRAYAKQLIAALQQAANKRPPEMREPTHQWIKAMFPFDKTHTMFDVLIHVAAAVDFFDPRRPEAFAVGAMALALQMNARSCAPSLSEVGRYLGRVVDLPEFSGMEALRELLKLLLDAAVGVPWLKAQFSPFRDKLKTTEGVKGSLREKLFACGPEIAQFWKPTSSDAVRQAFLGPNGLTTARMGDLSAAQDAELDALVAQDQESVTPAPAPVAASPPSELGRSPSAEVSPAEVPSEGDTEETDREQSLLRKGKRLAVYDRIRPYKQKKVSLFQSASSSLLSPFGNSREDASSSSANTKSTLRNSDQQATYVRQVLLAGTKRPSDIRMRAADQGILPSAHKDRLPVERNRFADLLWDRNIEDLDDDDLFEPGELDAMLRSEEEIKLLEETGRFDEEPKQTRQYRGIRMKRKIPDMGSHEDQAAELADPRGIHRARLAIPTKQNASRPGRSGTGAVQAAAATSGAEAEDSLQQWLAQKGVSKKQLSRSKLQNMEQLRLLLAPSETEESDVGSPLPDVEFADTLAFNGLASALVGTDVPFDFELGDNEHTADKPAAPVPSTSAVDANLDPTLL